MFSFKKIFSPQKRAQSESLYNSLAKSTPTLRNRISSLFSSYTKPDDEFIEELEEMLHAADIDFDTISKILDSFQKRYTAEKSLKTAVGRDKLYKKWLYESTLTLFEPERKATDSSKHLPSLPYIVVVIGVNGVGKTTSVAKLAHLFQEEGKQVIIGAGDTFRAGAINQLAHWCEMLNIALVKRPHKSDPASVCYDTVESALAQQKEVVIIDTAGRLHTDNNLMTELSKIVSVIQKKIPDAPHETLLVVDGTTGKNALEQAKRFSSVVPVSGIIVTKLDGTAKGGILISITDTLQAPILYIGMGEKVGDLVSFDARTYLKQLFDIHE